MFIVRTGCQENRTFIVRERIRNQTKFTNKEPIHKGWSCDRKYCAMISDGTKYLLRITPKEKSAGRADMFRMQQEVAALGVPVCKPVAFGVFRGQVGERFPAFHEPEGTL